MSDLLPVCGYEFDGPRCRRRGDHRCRGRIRHVEAFFTELLTHTKGKYARQAFIPARWQRRRILAPLFGEVVWDAAQGLYCRRYRVLYLFLPRKNGKSSLIAGLVLYLLIGDGEVGAEIYGLARDTDQASLVYRVAAAMVRQSPTLRERLQVVPSAGRIVDESTSSLFAVEAGDPEGNLGYDPSGLYLDELLTQPDRRLYDALRTSFGARSQPLMIMATTAEDDPGGFAASEREWSERVLADPSLDPERLVVMFGADEADDWTSPRTWRKCNPALGDFLEVRTLEAECRQALGNPAAERAFKQFRLNIPGNKVGRAIDLGAWDASAGEVAAARLPEVLAGRTCWAGLDLASTSDLASYALHFPEAGSGAASVIWRHFAPASALRELSRRTGGAADVWVAQGFLTLTEGNVIDYAAITTSMEADRETFDIREVAFDRWGATAVATDLIDRGFPLIQMGQGFASMAAPTAELLRMVKAGAYHHGANPLTRWEAGNAVARQDPAGNIKLDKAKSDGGRGYKIDGMVAGVMALDRALRAGAEVPADDYQAAGF